MGFLLLRCVSRSGKKNGYLKYIREFGSTNDNQLGDSTKKAGFFSIKFKANPDDILIIGNPGRAGAGAVAYYVGKLIKNE